MQGNVSMIIPIFLMNQGCRHRCIFCNERLTAGNHPDRITEDAFVETIRTYLDKASRKAGASQIAFYGGTFTGLNKEEQKRLLELAAPFLAEGSAESIRISTRPDEIDAETLDSLKESGVSTVEIGVQSFDDRVLLLSKRGHTAADSVRAINILKEKGFVTGIHLMAGLPGDSPEGFAETIKKTIELRPDTARIHPTIVLRDTVLAKDFREGRYRPLSLAEATEICKNALKELTKAGIPVIRLGLQTTRELEEPGAVVAGPFHPAFRSLVEAAVFLEMAEALLHTLGGGGKNSTFFVSPGDISSFQGLHRKNTALLEERFEIGNMRVKTDPSLQRGSLALSDGQRRLTMDFSGRIVG
jgi:histone acetyltransferase (RNA polymerase elongator complex component)